MATAYLENGLYDEAEAEYKASLKIQFVHRLVPLIESNLNILNLRRQIDQDPDNSENADLYNMIALNYFERGKYDRAEEFLTKALACESYLR